MLNAAFRAMYPGKSPPEFKLKYSASFKGYNANVRYNLKSMEFRLSRNWKDVSNEIKVGLVQNLMNKVFKTKINTINIEMYELFLENLERVAKVTMTDPILEESFEKNNQQYFYGMMLRPNLVWAGTNFRTLGTYDYMSDTIRISEVFRNNRELLDYIMYHEMLHKKLRYKKGAQKKRHHTAKFKAMEKNYHDPEIEKKLKRFLRFKKFFGNI